MHDALAKAIENRKGQASLKALFAIGAKWLLKCCVQACRGVQNVVHAPALLSSGVLCSQCIQNFHNNLKLSSFLSQ
jgi:hypothetical protein